MKNNTPMFKTAATVADVARMVGLSRERFYQLQRTGVFPMPVYDLATRRPLYTEEQQRECVEIKRRNHGANGRVVLFYSKGSSAPRIAAAASKKAAAACGGGSESAAWLVAALRGLGLDVTGAEADAATKVCFPAGTAGVDRGTAIRRLFLHLKRQNPEDKPG